MRQALTALVLSLLWALGAPWAAAASKTITIGSKNFTEQQILAELAAQLIEKHTDLAVERRLGLGGTGICHDALLEGELDLYIEYTGTGLVDVLSRPVLTDPDEAYLAVAQGYREQFDLHWLPPIGFNNTYAITVRGEMADKLKLKTVSDLASHADELSGGFTSEFVERPDGLPGLSKHYGLELQSVVDVDPGLMYKAVAEGQVDVISAFATDGRIAAYDLRVLKDDRSFFPPYDAAPVVRGQLLRDHPEVRDVLALLAGSISDDEMRLMNFVVDEKKQKPSEVARRWIEARERKVQLSEEVFADMSAEPLTVWGLAIERRAEIGEKTLEHLGLTLAGVMIAIVIGVPLGVMIHRVAATRGVIMAGVEIVQTIPSLAMLGFMFAVYARLGTWPAVTALVLYALLPIVLNTFTGLRELPPQVIEAAHGVGMSNRQRLWMVELPLAAPVIVAGIRAATVWTVGIATLCTFIGAGGLGDFIARGLGRDDPRLTLLGALPAAAMAVVLSLVIRVIERLCRNT